jgi:hypothetical protein
MGHPHEGVVWFSKEMEAKLEANSHKRGWDDIDLDYALQRMREEVEELAPHIDNWDYRSSQAKAIVEEAADVANFAMMLAYTVDSWREANSL